MTLTPADPNGSTPSEAHPHPTVQPTGPADLRDVEWRAGQVADLGRGIEATRLIWTTWIDGRRVDRLASRPAPPRVHRLAPRVRVTRYSAVRAEIAHDAPSAPRTYSVEDAADLIGIGRTFAYREIGAGHLRVARRGRRILVTEAAIREYLGERSDA